MILREVRMQNDVLQATQRDVIHVRQAGDGCRVEHAILDHTQAASPFRDKHGVPIREEHQAIRVRQAFCQLDDANGHPALALQHDRLVDRGARERVGWIFARDLRSRKRLGDAGRAGRHRTPISCEEGLLCKCGERNGRQNRDRQGETGYTGHSPSTTIFFAPAFEVVTVPPAIRGSSPQVRPGASRRRRQRRCIACPCTCR